MSPRKQGTQGWAQDTPWEARNIVGNALKHGAITRTLSSISDTTACTQALATHSTHTCHFGNARQAALWQGAVWTKRINQVWAKILTNSKDCAIACLQRAQERRKARALGQSWPEGGVTLDDDCSFCRARKAVQLLQSSSRLTLRSPMSRNPARAQRQKAPCQPAIKKTLPSLPRRAAHQSDVPA